MLLAEPLALATCALAAVIDQRRGVIPNTLTTGALGVAFLVHAAPALGLPGDLSTRVVSLGLHWGGGALLTALVPMLLWKKGALGAGDVKLFAALGAFLGPTRGLEASLYVFCLAAVWGAARLAREGALGKMLEHVALSALAPLRRVLGRRGASGMPGLEETWMRLGPAVLAGTCVALFLHPLSGWAR